MFILPHLWSLSHVHIMVISRSVPLFTYRTSLMETLTVQNIVISHSVPLLTYPISLMVPPTGGEHGNFALCSVINI